MTAVFTTPEDLVNDALVRIGWRGPRVGSLYDGSEPAKVALDLYGQTRDQLLRNGNWSFAQRDASLAATKTAPAGGYVTAPWTNAYPPVPWQYQYDYPGDCLKIRSIKKPPLFIPEWEPKNVNYDVFNDNSDTDAVVKAIIADVGPTILIVYTGQVVDPTNWEASFCETFSAELARRMAPRLANLQTAQLAGADEAITMAAATGPTQQG